MDLHIGSGILRYDSLLLREIAHTLEHEIRAAAGNLHIQLLPQRIHITADLLQIRARHMDDTGEVETRNLNVLHIRVEQLQEIVRDSGLLRVLHPNPQLIGIRRREIQSQGIIVPHCLDQLEKVNHIHPEHMLCRAVECLKPVRMQTQIHEHSMGLVNGHNLNALRIELQIRLRQNLLQRLNQSSECARLHRLDFK